MRKETGTFPITPTTYEGSFTYTQCNTFSFLKKKDLHSTANLFHSIVNGSGKVGQ